MLPHQRLSYNPVNSWRHVLGFFVGRPERQHRVPRYFYAAETDPFSSVTDANVIIYKDCPATLNQIDLDIRIILDTINTRQQIRQAMTYGRDDHGCTSLPFFVMKKR